METLVVEHPYALVACCAYLAEKTRDPVSRTESARRGIPPGDIPGLAHVVDSRTPDRRAVWLKLTPAGCALAAKLDQSEPAVA